MNELLSFYRKIKETLSKPRNAITFFLIVCLGFFSLSKTDERYIPNPTEYKNAKDLQDWLAKNDFTNLKYDLNKLGKQ